MNQKQSTAVAVLAALLSSISVAHAFTVVAPPVVIVQSPAQAQVPSVLASTSALPSQQELSQTASSFSTVNVAAATATAPAPAPAPAPAAKPSAVSSVQGGSVVTISGISYDGKVPTTEADEYVVVSNGSKNDIDVSGYYVYVATTGTQGPTFTFPKGSVIKPGQSVRIYTNEIHKETGGYSYGSGKAIWNNRGGLAVLRDSKGTKLAEFKYKAPA